MDFLFKIFFLPIIIPILFMDWILEKPLELRTFNLSSESNFFKSEQRGKHNEPCFYHYDGRLSATSTEKIMWFDSCPEKIEVPLNKIEELRKQIEKENKAIQTHNKEIENFRDYLESNYWNR